MGRNYARRRLREFFRRHKPLFPDGCELLIRLYSKPDDWDATLARITRMLARVRKKAASSPAAIQGREQAAPAPRDSGDGPNRNPR